MSQQTAIILLEAQQRKLEEQAKSGAKGAKGASLGLRPDDHAGSARAAWMVGEQLKDLCRREPRSAELLAQDQEKAGKLRSAVQAAVERMVAG